MNTLFGTISSENVSERFSSSPLNERLWPHAAFECPQKAQTKIGLSKSNFPEFRRHSKAAQRTSPPLNDVQTVCMLRTHRCYGTQKINIKRKINTRIRDEPVYRPALHTTMYTSNTCTICTSSINIQLFFPLITQGCAVFMLLRLRYPPAVQ